MHITGKIMIFLLLIPLAATSVWMSARLHVVRNSWSRQVDGLAEKNIDDASQIEINQKKINNLRSELARTMLPWVRHWNDVNARGSVEDGKLSLNAQFGSGNGMTRRSPNPVLHVFHPDAGGKYAYLGSYRATTVRPQQSALEPTWKYRPTDTLNLKSGKWRFRSLIPSGYSNRIAQLNTQLASSDVKLQDYNISIAGQEKLITQSDEILNIRRAELQGDETAKDVPGAPEFSKGYVATINEERDSRDNVLGELDTIRRQVKAEHDKMLKLIQKNKELASQLSSGGTPPIKTTAKKVTAAN